MSVASDTVLRQYRLAELSNTSENISLVLDFAHAVRSTYHGIVFSAQFPWHTISVAVAGWAGVSWAIVGAVAGRIPGMDCEATSLVASQQSLPVLIDLAVKYGDNWMSQPFGVQRIETAERWAAVLYEVCYRRRQRAFRDTQALFGYLTPGAK